MSGHTPGQWIEDYSDLDSGIDIKAGDIVIATAWSGVEGMKANARLIRLSPEMLTIANDIAAFFRTVYWNDHTSEEAASNLHIRLDAIISKAEGDR